jgi:hypothetical protein
MLQRLTAYASAILVGASLAIALFSWNFLWPANGLGWRPAGDAAQHIIAQRHFLADTWRWHPLAIGTLGGVNLAFVDGIPALGLLLKSLAPRPGFHGIGLFYALAWVLQPCAAVFALRGFGVRKLAPAIVVAVMAASMPAFVMRFGHAALCGHFVVLLALGFHARLLRDGRWWAAAIPFQVVALLVHPYLALMSLAVLAAVPLTLLFRREAWFGGAAGAAGAGAAMLGAMAVLDYLGAAGDGGFGQFAMNLLSPAWPRHSLLLGSLAPSYVDATGHGGWEGYNWLGLGLWVAVVSALWLSRGRLPWRRHLGLILALLGCTALALSLRVGLGERVLLDFQPVPDFLHQFRASGRFFWPVAYALLLASAVLLAREGQRGRRLLLLCAALQFLDATPQREALRAWAAEKPPWTIEADALRPLLATASRHSVVPAWACVPKEDWQTRSRILEILLLASETPRPVNTMYAARWREPPACVPPGPLLPGELRLVLPGEDPGAQGCTAIGDLLACRRPSGPGG